jgi:septal ring factor EnvC (AmiA/AmiB activator)
MAQTSEHWLEVAVRDPVLRAFVGSGMLISILLITNDVRKRLFTDKAQNESESVTQELRAVRDEHRDLREEYRELLRKKDIQIDNLLEENADLREDNTDLRNALTKLKTQDVRDNEDKSS